MGSRNSMGVAVTPTASRQAAQPGCARHLALPTEVRCSSDATRRAPALQQRFPPPERGAMTSASAQRRSSMCTTGSPTARHCRHSSSSPVFRAKEGQAWRSGEGLSAAGRQAGAKRAHVLGKQPQQQQLGHTQRHSEWPIKCARTQQGAAGGRQVLFLYKVQGRLGGDDLDIRKLRRRV